MPVTIVGNNTPTAGGVVYGDGTNYASTAAGTSGQALVSAGSSAPSFGTLGVAGGGTGATTLTSNNVILGNGTSAVQFVAPGTNGNLLTSDGTTWTSAAPPASGPVTLISTTTASASSTVDILLTGSYTNYLILLSNIVPSLVTSLRVRTSSNGGSSYDAGGTDYAHVSQYGTSASTGGGAGVVNASSGTDWGVLFPADISSTANLGGGNGMLQICRPSNASYTVMVATMGSAYDNTPGYSVSNSAIFRKNTSGGVNAIRFLVNGGTISSGVFKLYGVS
jgi:hypothetical protein